MRRIAFVSTYIPQKCGLATYTHHLRSHIRAARGWKGIDPVYVITDTSNAVNGADPALRVLPKHQRSAYRKAAERINQGDADIVSLQHEFGIFGGTAGEYVIDFAEQLQKPLVTTFHTVFDQPVQPYTDVQRQIAALSDRIIVMNRRAGRYLHEVCGVPEEKVFFIPHGAPIPGQTNREQTREKLGWGGRTVLMTFGLISRNKGLETILRAMPGLIKEVPNALYAIVGQTHPEVRKREGESYREELQKLTQELGIENHVQMVNEYLDEQDLIAYLEACDLYVTPYPGLQQITSGTLAYAAGLGKPLLSTPYIYAKDLLEDYPELLVPPNDPASWEERMIQMCSSPTGLKEWADRIAHIGQHLQWPEVGRNHLKLFEETAELLSEKSLAKEGSYSV